MDIKRAIELLKGLADGVNPLTGEVLSPQDSCNQVEIVRALHCVIEHSKARLNSHLEMQGLHGAQRKIPCCWKNL